MHAVEAPDEIATQVGKKDWNFSVEPCSNESIELVNTHVGFEAIAQQISNLQLLLPCWRMPRGSIVCHPSFPLCHPTI
jgi:hypothetical protein